MYLSLTFELTVRTNQWIRKFEIIDLNFNREHESSSDIQIRGYVKEKILFSIHFLYNASSIYSRHELHGVHPVHGWGKVSGVNTLNKLAASRKWCVASVHRQTRATLRCVLGELWIIKGQRGRGGTEKGCQKTATGASPCFAERGVLVGLKGKYRAPGNGDGFISLRGIGNCNGGARWDFNMEKEGERWMEGS